MPSCKNADGSISFKQEGDWLQSSSTANFASLFLSYVQIHSFYSHLHQTKENRWFVVGSTLNMEHFIHAFIIMEGDLNGETRWNPLSSIL